MITTSIEYTAAGKVFQGLLVAAEADPAYPAVDSSAQALGSSASPPPEARPGILVFHGGAGPGEHERARARRLAELGYVAFVPDLFGETFESRAHGMAVISGLVAEPAILRERVNAALQRIRREPSVDPKRTGAIGFCFGGLAALELARSGADVDAVVSFHGGLQAAMPAHANAIVCKILVCTGAVDPFVTREQRAAFEDEMTNANVDWQMLVHGGAQHGFTETTAVARPGCSYHAGADRASWSAMQAHFDAAMGRVSRAA